MVDDDTDDDDQLDLLLENPKREVCVCVCEVMAGRWRGGGFLVVYARSKREMGNWSAASERDALTLKALCCAVAPLCCWARAFWGFLNWIRTHERAN